MDFFENKYSIFGIVSLSQVHRDCDLMSTNNIICLFVGEMSRHDCQQLLVLTVLRGNVPSHCEYHQ
jgi:hypothetical protein